MKKIVDCKELALKKVNISGNVIGKFGTFEIEQTFVNNTNKENITRIDIENGVMTYILKYKNIKYWQ